MVGVQRLGQFADLTGVHSDGWGMAWWGGDPFPAVTHSTKAAAEDPDFISAGATIASDAALLHLRWATPGMAVAMANCHPFVCGDLALAHNGGIYPLDRLNQILPPEWEAKVRGTTDSERYMLAVVAALQAGGGAVADVLGGIVARLFTEWAPTSLNAMCLTPEALFVVSAYNPYLPAPVDRNPAEDYYTLRYRRTPEGVVVASSGIDQPASDGWRPIDNMTVMTIHRHTAESTFTAVPLSESSLEVSTLSGRVADRR